MKKIFASVMFLNFILFSYAGNVEKTFNFGSYTIRQTGNFHSIVFDNTQQAGLTGEPSLPWHSVSLLLPPGEKAVSIEIAGDQLTEIPETLKLFPAQYSSPVSKGHDGKFIIKEDVYRMNQKYPVKQSGRLSTQYLNGYAFALSTFTPVVYNPFTGKASYYKSVTVTVHTSPSAESTEALKNFSASPGVKKRVSRLAQNRELMELYPAAKAAQSAYQLLIISPFAYQTAYQPLIDFYTNRSISSSFQSVEYINQAVSGADLPEKIRNYIKTEYQNNGIEQVILGGDVALVPFRGFYCYVISGGGYEEYNIPADIYFSGLDGNWNTNGNNKWAEPGEDDLLPEISVGRMSFSTDTELANMINKSIGYQSNPSLFAMNKPMMVGEFLYDPPVTYGQDYLELLVDDHNDNGYFTHGIPSATNNITRLYDTTGYNWGVGQLLSLINSGQAFIHHCGHSNSNYMMRLYNWDITDQNFSQVNGIITPFQLMYSHGCICGAFDDDDCIAEKATTIQNWLAGGCFNSRYGWFNQGTTEGPSAHIHREFISAIYNPDADSAITELGMAHTMSKIMTAPWCNLPGEFEPGAQRWCMYDCNVLGDPEMKVWRDNPAVGTAIHPEPLVFSITPNPCSNQFNITIPAAGTGPLTFSVINALGINVMTNTIPETSSFTDYKVNVSGLPTGFYSCRLSNSSGSTVRQFIIAR